MAYVIHSINITASGLCHHLDSAIDDEHTNYAIDLTTSANALVLGRCTFDLFAQFWPGALDIKDLPASTLALARAFNSVQKFVVSSQPVELTWNNTSHIQGPGLEHIRRELQKLRGTVVIFGSPSLASSLLCAELIDEIHLLAQPFIGVEGPQAFAELRKRVDLKLLDVKPMQVGSVLLRYKVT